MCQVLIVFGQHFEQILIEIRGFFYQLVFSETEKLDSAAVSEGLHNLGQVLRGKAQVA